MANVLINQDTMKAIADAIREKLDETATYLPSEMPAKILSIVSAPKWEWGDESGLADATWWANLRDWAKKATAAERQAVVGKWKYMGFSTTTFGGTSAPCRCIGADHDGTGTLTFQIAAFSYNTNFPADTVYYANQPDTRNALTTAANNCYAKDVLVAAPRICSLGSSTTTITDKFVLPSATELFGINAYNGKAEGKQYDYFKTAANRIYPNIVTYTGAWTRSAATTSTMYYLYHDGSYTTSGLTISGLGVVQSRGAAPIFVVG